MYKSSNIIITNTSQEIYLSIVCPIKNTFFNNNLFNGVCNGEPKRNHEEYRRGLLCTDKTTFAVVSAPLQLDGILHELRNFKENKDVYFGKGGGRSERR